MVYLAFIFHMHQPYYKNLLTNEADLPWVRLHGTKDYLDMVRILEKYPKIHQTFNLVPSLIEQIQDYANNSVIDKFLNLSYKPVSGLIDSEKNFIKENFFMINTETVISRIPRYYELYLNRLNKKNFLQQDYLDLQIWFNLAWIDPMLRESNPHLKTLAEKGRFFSEEDKRLVLDEHLKILKQIIPEYKKFSDNKQIELTISPYYHPILPLLCDTEAALEANPAAILPKARFAHPEDALAQIKKGTEFFESVFGFTPKGMWPSEEGVSEQILSLLIQSNIKWIVTDEAILFKSLKKKKRDTRLLYQPYLLKRKHGEITIIFRDRNLSDLIGFVYNKWSAEKAVGDFLTHLNNIHAESREKDILVTVAMDGENAWEYFPNDGHYFLNLLYSRLQEKKHIRTVTVSEYLNTHCPARNIEHLAAGSWIYAEFAKWIGSPCKNRAWEYLTRAREDFEKMASSPGKKEKNINLAARHIHAAEGSDWFWWYDENEPVFDRLFRMHLSNFYTSAGEEIPGYLKKPLST